MNNDRQKWSGPWSNCARRSNGPKIVERISLDLVPTWAPNANEAAAGLLAACEGVALGRIGSWSESRPGLLALMTTLPGRPYNGLYGLGETATPKDATALVLDLAASGVSWCARLRPSVPEEIDKALGDMGLIAEDETLLMATSLVAHDFSRYEPLELNLHTRHPEDDLAIATVLGAAFGALPSSAAKLLDPAHLSCNRTQWHLAKVDGVAVSCAMSVVAGDAVGIFAVGTIPQARGKGYASAVTSRALARGYAAGARLGVLTANPDVQGVYQHLGFSVMEHWRRLVPSP